jgi:hypothetical protein
MVCMSSNSENLDLLAMPRDLAAERGEARPSFNLASYIPARLRAVAGAHQRTPIVGIAFTDADGRGAPLSHTSR